MISTRIVSTDVEAVRANRRFIQLHQPDAIAVRTELAEGLSNATPYSSPKYLYDALGSKLFEAICELPEYYPTRTEAAILTEHIDAIAAAVGEGTTLIDLGAGNCAKAARLFSSLQPSQYVPVDISVEFLRDAVESLQQRFPQIEMTGVGLDFSTSLDLPDAVNRHRRLFFYPGSSIGNFSPKEALAFLRRLHTACTIDGRSDGGLLIGIDLVKDADLLDAAYDDALGVTAAFNLNLLRHLNELLDADFNIRDWKHRGFFNSQQSRIEMHLEARRDVEVSWHDGSRQFQAGQTIHTENSYKYRERDFVALLETAGFGEISIWTDPKRWFMVCHARALQLR